jgi:hypothetical protein
METRWTIPPQSSRWSYMRYVLSLCLAVLCVGCADANRDKPTGSLPSGNPDEIQDLVEGGGATNATLRAMPVGRFREPEMPLIKNPRDKVAYVAHQWWPDGSAYHEPFFMHVIVERARYAMVDNLRQNSVPLNELDNIVIDRNGRVLTSPRALPFNDNDLYRMSSGGSAAGKLPVTPGGETRLRTTRVMIEGADGTLNETARSTAPIGSNLITPDGRFNQSGMNASLMESQAGVIDAMREQANSGRPMAAPMPQR